MLCGENPKASSAIAAVAGAVADVQLKEFDSIDFGPFSLYALSTPGHTQASFYLHGDVAIHLTLVG
jgi:hypothetical protein